MHIAILEDDAEQAKDLTDLLALAGQMKMKLEDIAKRKHVGLLAGGSGLTPMLQVCGGGTAAGRWRGLAEGEQQQCRAVWFATWVADGWAALCACCQPSPGPTKPRLSNCS